MHMSLAHEPKPYFKNIEIKGEVGIKGGHPYKILKQNDVRQASIEHVTRKCY